MPNYGQRVRSLRESAGWSQNSLAVRMGGFWRQTTVARVESGEQPLRLTDAVALAEIFGLTLDEFASSSQKPCRCADVRRVLTDALAALD